MEIINWDFPLEHFLEKFMSISKISKELADSAYLLFIPILKVSK